jgi:hypothetical protein
MLVKIRPTQYDSWRWFTSACPFFLFRAPGWPIRGGRCVGQEPPTPGGSWRPDLSAGCVTAGGRAYARLDNGMGHNRAQPYLNTGRRFFV